MWSKSKGYLFYVVASCSLGRRLDQCHRTADAAEAYTAGSKHAQNQCLMYCISVAKVLDTSAMH